jgi:hypothetical protein
MDKVTDLQLYVLEKGQVSCRDFEALYGEYIEGDLLPTLTERLEAHKDSCSVCQKLAADYHLTIELAAELGQAKIPSGVSERLRMGLNKKLGINLPISQA